MDWIQYLNKAIDYIEENLDGTISYNNERRTSHELSDRTVAGL